MNLVALILAVGAGCSLLAGIIQGLVAWYSMDPKTRIKLRPFIIGCIVVTIVFTGASYYSSVSTQRASATSPTVTPTQTSPSPTATQVVPDSTMTAQPTLQPTDTEVPTMQTTPSPTLSGPEMLTQNIHLNCNCSDRVVVTITKIVIQPQQTRMIWSMTFFNNSQKSAYAVFADSNFYLQKGDQINDPEPEEQKYGATGSVIGTFSGISLQAGETQQVTVTFSFVPYTATPYTFVSIMQMDCCGQEIATFDPVLLTF